jgi:hypothetical protein
MSWYAAQVASSGISKSHAAHLRSSKMWVSAQHSGHSPDRWVAAVLDGDKALTRKYLPQLRGHNLANLKVAEASGTEDLDIGCFGDLLLHAISPGPTGSKDRKIRGAPGGPLSLAMGPQQANSGMEHLQPAVDIGGVFRSWIHG